MRFKPAVLLFLALGACQSASDQYPSLELRPAEVSGWFEVPPPQPYVPPPTPAAALSRLEQLTAEAASAHRAFLAEVPEARGLVGAARGSAPGDESWAVAQVALAGLEADRSRAMIALADLDRLLVDASLEGTALDRITAARDRVAAQVEEQNATIESLLRSLR